MTAGELASSSNNPSIQKLNLARRLLVVFYQDDKARQELLGLFERVERVISRRNDNVHALQATHVGAVR